MAVPPPPHGQQPGTEVDLVGFLKLELNGRYVLRPDRPVLGKATWWEAKLQYFAYWEPGQLQRWSICGAESHGEVLKGAALGWAFQRDDGPFAQTSHWLERAGEEAWPQTLVTATIVPKALPQQLPRPGGPPVAAAPPPPPTTPPPPATPPPTAVGPADAAAGGAAGQWAAPGRWPEPSTRRRVERAAAPAALAAQPAAVPAVDASHSGSRGREADPLPQQQQHQQQQQPRDRWQQQAANSFDADRGSRQGRGVRDRDGRSSRADWAEERNVQARTNSGPAWASGASAVPDTQGRGNEGSLEEDSPHLRPVDWALLALPPFQRAFLPYGVVDPREARMRRQELQIEVEEEPAGPGATPAPVKAFPDLTCIPSWVHAALRENAWDHPMPIQAQALPILLAGKNLIGLAQTGSGKTAAFLLNAIVQIDSQPRLTKYSPGPVTLVLSPTRELAVQISDEATKLLKFSSDSRNHPDGITSAVFYGGGRKWQQLRWFGDEGSHILVATPGRLLDFMKEGNVSLRRVTYLVFDEADRMLDLGFADDMKAVSAQVRPERQMAYFSATWPKAVQALAEEFCNEAPVRIRCGGREGSESSAQGADSEGAEAVPNARESIVQEVVVMESEDGDWSKIEEEKLSRIKRHVARVFEEGDESKVLVFVNEKGQVDRLSNDLWDQGFAADGIHSGRKQDMRLEVLEKFRQGRVRVLVATDVIGRGLDIPKVSHVVVHSMGDVEDYVHRIGRTGRGKDGKGHALVFFEYYHNRPETADRLIGVLERAKQHVPPELRKIAEDVASGRRGGESRGGWGGRSSWGSGRRDKEGAGWKSGSGGWQENGGWRDGGWKSDRWKEPTTSTWADKSGS